MGRIARVRAGWLLVAGIFLVPLLALVAAGQQPAATITFTCDFSGSEPPHYEVKISADGHGSYSMSSSSLSQADSATSADASSPPQAEENYQTDFDIPESTATHIFDLAKRAHYFADGVDSGKKKLASTGAKILSYNAPGQSTHASYNYSLIPAVQELTTIFQGLSTTLEFARRLDYDLRYQKTALDEELKRMEDMASSHNLVEIAAAGLILRKIVDDPSIMNVSRSRAQRLLARSSGSK